jgi:starch synthase
MKKNNFSILMITSEAVPYAKSGGLGDVVSALSKELREAGHDVRIVLPRYYDIDKEKMKLLPGPLGVPLGFGQEWVGVYTAALPGSEVPVYFLDHEGLFGRTGIYGPSPDEEYPDNSKRFTLLSRGAFQLCRKLQWIPEIMHAHDWPAALVPVFLYTLERKREFADTAGVFTIHNLGYQGIFPKQDIHYSQLSWKHYHETGFEFHDKLNFLQAGLKQADILTTVSPGYAREIQEPENGFHMDGILRHRKGDLFGIVNGIDYSIWDPAADPLLPYHYSAENSENKRKVKRKLQKQFALPVNDRVPIISMITRLVDQKGIGALAGPAYGSLHKICLKLALQFIVLGTGEAWCEDELRKLASKLPNLRVHIGYNSEAAHLIEGGSDFFLMPSKYEPCGLNQMYSLRYGTLPIVRRTGGLADTVENYNQETGEGTGFVFDNLTPESIFDTVGWAVWTWYNKPEHIAGMRKTAMEKRFSWEKSAARYTDLYQWALDRKSGRFPRVW